MSPDIFLLLFFLSPKSIVSRRELDLAFVVSRRELDLAFVVSRRELELPSCCIILWTRYSVNQDMK